MKCLNCGENTSFSYFCNINCEVEYCDKINAQSVAEEEIKVVSN